MTTTDTANVELTDAQLLALAVHVVREYRRLGHRHLNHDQDDWVSPDWLTITSLVPAHVVADADRVLAATRHRMFGGE